MLRWATRSFCLHLGADGVQVCFFQLNFDCAAFAGQTLHMNLMGKLIAVNLFRLCNAFAGFVHKGELYIAVGRGAEIEVDIIGGEP